MAGSPGAGKTEFSKELVDLYDNTAVRIDADDIRSFFEDYDGLNAHVFQKAVSIGVDILYRFCLANNFNIIIDGTFAHKRVSENIQKSLDKDKDRRVFIDFIYQKPEVAWNFTKNRELVDHRKITKDSFIRTFLQSRENVNMVKVEFGNKIELNLFIKNLSNDKVEIGYLNIDQIDGYLERIYTIDELLKLII